LLDETSHTGVVVDELRRVGADVARQAVHFTIRSNLS
jgi:hypothetical protein